MSETTLTVNGVPALRHRLIDDELWEFVRVDPGYTILLQDDSFSFCDARHFDDFDDYYITPATESNRSKLLTRIGRRATSPTCSSSRLSRGSVLPLSRTRSPKPDMDKGAMVTRERCFEMQNIRMIGCEPW